MVNLNIFIIFIGGILKQLSIGCGTAEGKTYQHSGGATNDPREFKEKRCGQDQFMDSMADAAATVVRHFKGNMVFINTLKDIGLQCDCAHFDVLPVMEDIGIVGGIDPVAVDQASIDLVLSSKDEGRKLLLDKLNRLHGYRTLKKAEEHGIGKRKYELITIS